MQPTKKQFENLPHGDGGKGAKLDIKLPTMEPLNMADDVAANGGGGFHQPSTKGLSVSGGDFAGKTIYGGKALAKMGGDKWHNFPKAIENMVLSQEPTLIRPDGRMEFLLKGFASGKGGNMYEGVFHITLSQSRVITHHTFVPMNDWVRFATRWGLPISPK